MKTDGSSGNEIMDECLSRRDLDPAELLRWKNQICAAARLGLRNGYLLSTFAIAIGCFFVILYIGPDVPDVARDFFREGRHWWPLLGVALFVLAIGGAGFWFSHQLSQRLHDAVDTGTPRVVSVRFVDHLNVDPIRYEARFDVSENPGFAESLQTRIWQYSPRRQTPPTGQSVRALALLDPKTQTPIAVTIDTATYIFDDPAHPVALDATG